MSAAHRETKPLPNSYWVVSGRFAAGEYPGAKQPARAAARLQSFFSAGIDHFIDLTEAGELVPYAEIAMREATRIGQDVVYERHPIVDLNVPERPEQMDSILDAIDAALDDDKTIYVHCWGGVGRTGTVVGCWLVRHGSAGPAALDQIAEWWKDVEKSCRIRQSPETRDQRAYVRHWSELPNRR